MIDQKLLMKIACDILSEKNGIFLPGDHERHPIDENSCIEITIDNAGEIHVQYILDLPISNFIEKNPILRKKVFESYQSGRIGEEETKKLFE